MIEYEDELIREEPTECDYEIATAHTSAQLEVRTLEIKINTIRFEAQRQIDDLQPSLQAAKQKLAKVQQLYREVQERVGIDPYTDTDEETLPE